MSPNPATFSLQAVVCPQSRGSQFSHPAPFPCGYHPCEVLRANEVHGDLRKRSYFLGAYIPDLPGVITIGDSREEVERLMREAVEFHLEGLREEGLPIPGPSSVAGEIEVPPAA
jgi:predicted RNase H-like HicB family nuclease